MDGTTTIDSAPWTRPRSCCVRRSGGSAGDCGDSRGKMVVGRTVASQTASPTRLNRKTRHEPTPGASPCATALKKTARPPPTAERPLKSRFRPCSHDDVSCGGGSYVSGGGGGAVAAAAAVAAIPTPPTPTHVPARVQQQMTANGWQGGTVPNTRTREGPRGGRRRRENSTGNRDRCGGRHDPSGVVEMASAAFKVTHGGDCAGSGDCSGGRDGICLARADQGDTGDDDGGRNGGGDHSDRGAVEMVAVHGEHSGHGGVGPEGGARRGHLGGVCVCDDSGGVAVVVRAGSTSTAAATLRPRRIHVDGRHR